MQIKFSYANFIKSTYFIPLLLTFTITLFLTKITFAQMVVNEFDVFTSPQAVELFNTSDQSIDISGWYLDDSGGTTYVSIPAQSPIQPHTCVVVRGSLFLNTSSTDTVRLFDNSAPPTSTPHLIDSYSYTQFTSSGNSYSRLPDGNGTFTIMPSSLGFTNSNHIDCTATIPTPSPTPFPSPTSTISPTSTPAFPTLTPTPTLTLIPNTPTPTFTTTPTPIPHIFISEIMVNPSSGYEWIELYNDSSEPYNIHNWFVDDMISAGSSPMIFSTFLPAYGYATIDISNSIFNNTGDSVRLVDNESHEVEVLMYNTSQQDISWGRQTLNSNSFCFQIPTKGTSNNQCLAPTITPGISDPTPTPTSLLSPTPTLIPPNNIYLSELYVNTNTNEHEWIELYNDNRYAVQLTNWKIKDATDQVIATVALSLDAYRYGVVELMNDKMNNADEQIFLINSSGEVVDHFSYTDSEKGISWGRSTGNFSTWCLQNPSRNIYNHTCILQSSPTPTPTDIPTHTPTPTKTRTPTPTTRLSVGSQKSTSSTGSRSSGQVLGTSISTLTVNFTPQAETETNKIPSKVTKEELPEINVNTSANITGQFLVYIFLTSLCMIAGGFQIARLWTLYQNYTPAYPDMFG